MKQNLGKKITVTIVTVVFNGEQYLEKTIKSVIAQSFEKEYIIIDGGSTDRTVDIIKNYEDYIDYFISEKDDGIYNAMNKGIDLAKGKWINFMNAGDTFYNQNTLKNIFQEKDYENITFIYGDVQTDYKTFKKNKKSGNIDNLVHGMQFSHQSVFVKTKYHKKYKFNELNTIGADFEFLYQAYKTNKKFFYTNSIISTISNGGLSDIKRVSSILGCWKVIGYNQFKINIFYIKLLSKEIMKKLIKQLLGKKLTNMITRRI